MFRQAKNIDTAFRHFRLFSVLLLLSCTGISTYTLYKSYQVMAVAGQRIYLLAGGKALEAFASDQRENIPVEARDHVRMFHTYFFSLDPDDKVIEANVAKALYLADATAKQQYDNLRENNYYNNIISGNISQQIEIDSITLDTGRYPYYFRCMAKQKIIRPTTVVTRNLVTEGFLRTVARSDNNPHGFLIEKWKTLENRDLKIENR
jgi:conjugative transposon TraK protein